MVMGITGILLTAVPMVADEPTDELTAEPTSLSSMLSEDSLKKYQELDKTAQRMINKLLPVVLKEDFPIDIKRDIMDSIVQNAYEQLCDDDGVCAPLRSEFNSGIEMAPNISYSYIYAYEDKRTMYADIFVNPHSDYYSCGWCELAFAAVAYPTSPGKYNGSAYVHGADPEYERTLYDTLDW